MFTINKTIQIPVNPTHKLNCYQIILEHTETFLRKSLRNNDIKLFAVNYKEVRSPDNRYRRFHVINATNQKDK